MPPAPKVVAGSPPPVASVPAGPLPTWVPAAGNVAVLTQANSFLKNTYASVISPWYSSFHSIKAINDDSTTIANPYWGQWGAVVSFGGGHASTNYNGVHLLELQSDGVQWKQLTHGTPIFGSAPDLTTQRRNDGYELATHNASINEWGEYVVAGLDPRQHPAAPHSYDSLDILPPSAGGATYGSLIVPIIGAPGRRGSLDSGPGISVSCHVLDFATTAGTVGSYTWRRDSDRRGSRPDGGPTYAAYVPAQRRAYVETRGATASQAPQWYDFDAKQYVTGTGSRRANNSLSAQGGVMFAIPERDLVVHMDPSPDGTQIRVQYMRVRPQDTDPGWVPGPMLGIAPPIGWSAACWCADSQRILIGNTIGAPNRVYELALPTNLADPWMLDSHDAPGPTISWPANPVAGTPVYGKWTYNPKVRAIVAAFVAVYPGAQPAEQVWVYRPRGT